jgi:BirA family biotin operon repressor/biotin-[acetyl-CoA-carboxylase] ligase
MVDRAASSTDAHAAHTLLSRPSWTPRAVWRLSTRHLGQRVLVFSQVESTNDRAAELASNPANAGVVLLADSQTAGRGQYDRQWTCPPGLGVLMSALLFPPSNLQRPVILAAWAAVAVSETIREMASLEARLKWPNDVLLEGRKVAGILVERRVGTVTGIGLNVKQSRAQLAELGLPDATSLHAETGRDFDVAWVARRLVERLDDEYDQLLAGCLAPLQERWKAGLGLVGRRVRVECHDRSIECVLLDATFDFIEVCPIGSERPTFLRPEMIRRLTAHEP